MSDIPRRIGKYGIVSELGRRRMGSVHVALDGETQRRVVLKVLSKPFVADDKLRERFLRIAETLSTLKHPNVVEVVDWGHAPGGYCFLALESLDGSDLQQLSGSRRLSLTEKLDIISQTCRGLAHAHHNGLVHRNVKPAHIVVTEQGLAKVAELDVMPLEAASWPDEILGTPNYMSPEQIRGRELDGRSDVFGAGIVLHELLAGSSPFSGENIRTTFFRILNEPRPPLMTADGERVVELDAILDRALAKDVDERFASADEMADALEGFRSGRARALPEDVAFSAEEPDPEEISPLGRAVRTAWTWLGG